MLQAQGTAGMYKGPGADRGHSPQDSPGAGQSLVQGKRERQEGGGRGWWAARKTWVLFWDRLYIVLAVLELAGLELTAAPSCPLLPVLFA